MMTWREINLSERVWTVPANRMKLGVTHTVPLSDAAIRILKIQPKGDLDDIVFSMRAGKPMSDMTIGAVIKRMNAKRDDSQRFRDPDGRSACPHGLEVHFAYGRLKRLGTPVTWRSSPLPTSYPMLSKPLTNEVRYLLNAQR